MICALNRAGLGDKMQMNVVGGACGTYGEGEVFTVFWWGKLSERCQLEGLVLRGVLISP